jgi:hypothetical protein
MSNFQKSAIYTGAVAAVYSHYIDICDSSVIGGCAFSNLTYNQWLSGSVLLNPLPGQVVNDTSFVRNY